MIHLEVEALVLLIVISAAFLLYRMLIRSKWFSKLVSGTKPLPESSEEVLGRLDEAECVAEECASKARRAALTNRKTARTIRQRIGRKPQ